MIRLIENGPLERSVKSSSSPALGQMALVCRGRPWVPKFGDPARAGELHGKPCGYVRAVRDRRREDHSVPDGCRPRGRDHCRRYPANLCIREVDPLTSPAAEASANASGGHGPDATIRCVPVGYGTPVASRRVESPGGAAEFDTTSPDHWRIELLRLGDGVVVTVSCGDDGYLPAKSL